MTPLPRLAARRIAWMALAGAIVLATLLARSGAPPAQAAATGDAPVFSSPTRITNVFLPVVPGAVKVFRGSERGQAVMTIENHLGDTRDFAWGAAVVTCRVVEQVEFLHGVERSRSRMYLAQSDDGAVWAFGEVEDDDTDTGEDDGDDPGGWIVGDRSAEDPVAAVSAAAPALAMPASPARGDAWASTDLAPHFSERRRVLREGDTLRFATGRRTGCLKLAEEDLIDATVDVRWYAPGLGLVRTQGPRESLTLAASTIRPAR